METQQTLEDLLRTMESYEAATFGVEDALKRGFMSLAHSKYIGGATYVERLLFRKDMQTTIKVEWDDKNGKFNILTCEANPSDLMIGLTASHSAHEAKRHFARTINLCIEMASSRKKLGGLYQNSKQIFNKHASL